jgi:hypothetical protein
MIKINRIRKAIQNNHNLQKTDAKKEAETSDLITKSAKVLCKDASRSDLPLDLLKDLRRPSERPSLDLLKDLEFKHFQHTQTANTHKTF